MDNGVKEDAMITNIMSIGNKTLIVNNSSINERTNQIFSDLGFKIETVSLNNMNLLGGSFRCASMPLTRGI